MALPLSEHVHQIRRAYKASLEEVLDLDALERCLTVARILQDNNHEDEKFTHLIDVMCKLWGARR